MLIGEICSKTELSRDTIRYYEKRGLIKVELSNSAFNNYKNYTEENLRRLMLIKRSKKFGFTLNEILDFMELVDNNKANCSTLNQKITEKIASIDQRIQELQEMKSSITRLAFNAQKKCGNRSTDENCKEYTEIKLL